MNVNECWKFDNAMTYGRSERETWYCKECSRKVIVTSYRGKRNSEELSKPCKCYGGDNVEYNVNVNQNVKVKLTNLGMFILRQRHEKLHNSIIESGGIGLEPFDLKIDEEGYYTTQLWMLIRDFGHVMNMGLDEPFDVNIIILKGIN